MPQLQALPQFIAPMLAAPGEPFDSNQYLFEVKWDGTRALAFVDGPETCRLVNRRRVAMNERYPELACLGQLPVGTVLDGEIVVLRGGKPDFQALQSREQARRTLQITTLSKSMPATFMAFDLLYQDYKPVMHETLAQRRERLAEIVLELDQPKLILSMGITGQGKAYFRAVCAQGLEGMVAKRLKSQYAPGKRNGAWLKVKQCHRLLCAVVGFVQRDQARDFRALLLATEQRGQAVYVGRVASGIDEAVRAQLNALLWNRLLKSPVVACPGRAKWVEPDIYCNVSYLERTASGQLRSPVFEGLCNGH